MAEVIIRHKANIRPEKILEAAYTDYGQTTLNRFLSELEHIEHRLAIQPESYPLERSLMGLKKKYRYCTLKKNFKLIYFYRPRLDKVVIVTVWDTRMNPVRLVKEFRK